MNPFSRARLSRARVWVSSRSAAWIAVPAVLVGLVSSAILFSYATSGVERLCDAAADPCLQLADLRAGNPYDDAVELYDMRDSSLALVGGRSRRFVSLREMPPLVRDAWIAVEDRRFREHDGVDGLGILRATATNLTAGGVESGASTIAMQLVRVLWEDHVWEMNRWRRKLLEARTAPRLVEELGRERVLELYLNGIYLGDGVYGVSAASRHYFGRTLSELTPQQVALLVAITRTPGRYEPREHPERARERRNTVLRQLQSEGLIDSKTFERARSAPLGVSERSQLHSGRTWVSAAVRRELRRVAPEIAGRSGLRVFTTVDRQMQAKAEKSVSDHLQSLTGGELGKVMTPDAQPQGALVALDARRGAIRAIVGGHDFDETELDRALQTRRQVGSLAKPLLLASFLDRGGRASSLVSTASVEVDSREGDWRPRDHVGSHSLMPWEVISRSSNRGAVRIGLRVGVDTFAEDLLRWGMEGPIPRWPSIFLGSFEASVLEMTTAYATFENGGARIHPHLIRRVEDHTGVVLYLDERSRIEPSRQVTESAAYIVHQALREAATSGTGWQAAARSGRKDITGKTGTSDEGYDAWFVGSTSGLSVGIWIGHDHPSPVTEGGGGGTLAAPLWGRFVGSLDLGGVPPSTDPPRTVRRVAIDRRTGVEVPLECAGDATTRFADAWVRTSLSRRRAGTAAQRPERVNESANATPASAQRSAVDRCAAPGVRSTPVSDRAQDIDLPLIQFLGADPDTTRGPSARR